MEQEECNNETTDQDHSDGNITIQVQETRPQQVAASDLLQLIDQLNKTIAALLTERDKPRLQPPKLPPLADGDDVDAVLTRFEQHMVTYDVPRHQWMLHL